MRCDLVIYVKGKPAFTIHQEHAEHVQWTCAKCMEVIEIREGYEEEDCLRIGSHKHEAQ